MRQKIELRQPLMINGKNYKELEYDFDELTCEDYTTAATYADSKALRASQSGKPNASIMEQNVSFHMYLGMTAVVAVNRELIDIADMERLKGYDLVEITQIGRNFITGRSAEPSEQNNLEKQSEVTPESTIPESKK
ncbi:MAG: early nodulin 20 (N-20) [Lachnospiraceae bacterium]|nr:early nodulin 20 (N-20) [Lachnospiraceae bacterium]MDE7204064.1 early nodulin 20 (N-20) [Lachnospiraceae bacterium]